MKTILILVAMSFAGLIQDSAKATRIWQGNTDTIFVDMSYYWHFLGGARIIGSCYAYVDEMKFWKTDTIRDEFSPIILINGGHLPEYVNGKMQTLSRPSAIVDSGKYLTKARWTICLGNLYNPKYGESIDSGWKMTLFQTYDFYRDSAHSIGCGFNICSTFDYVKQGLVYPFKRVSAVEVTPKQSLRPNSNYGNYYYDIRGRKLSAAPTRAGIYLFQGRKVVVMK